MRTELERSLEAEAEESPTQDLQSVPTRALDPLPSSPRPRPDADPEPSEPPAPPDVATGPRVRRMLGRYTVLGELGRGGMGVVLEAFDRRLDRRVALKVLHRGIDEEHTKRLLREAQALAKLSHPNVVQVYEVGEAAGQTFIAMELVQGRSLRAWLSQSPRPRWRECVQVYLQAGEGLAAAHAQGLVHRDFKPSNAVLDDAGRVHVLDFGLARRVEDPAALERSLRLSVEEAALEEEITQAGTVMGTPAYMPPEQMRGLEVDARSDQFAYCVALYEALHGERPFVGTTMEVLLAAVAAGAVRPVPRGSEVPPELRAAVLRGLAAEPSERWPSMEALLAQLRRTVAPRRRSWLAIGVVAGLATIGVGLLRHAEVGQRCEGARAQLEGVWDEARAQQLARAIAGTGLPYAADTGVRVQERLDAYASAWAREHAEACEATSVRQEQSPEVMDLRMACLRAQRLALQETVDVLLEPDATRLEHAVELVTRLPEPSACADVEALRAGLPAPEDPTVAAEVEALRGQLAEAQALRDAGAYADAHAIADRVTTRAEALPYPPLLAEALFLRGAAHQDMARYAEAEQDELRAYRLAAEHGHEIVEAKAATRLVVVVGARQARYEAGLQWGLTALALAKGLPGQPALEGTVLHFIGLVLRGQGRVDDALDHLRRALAIYERVLGPEHTDVAGVLHNLALTLHDKGELSEAMTQERRALEIFERALGPRHPGVAAMLNSLGSLHRARDELSEALALHERALAIAEGALGPDHRDVAFSLLDLGAVRYERGELPAARAAFERAAAITERALGPEHPELADLLINLGVVLSSQGELEAALAHQRRALAIEEAAQGPVHPDVAAALDSIGGTLERQGRHDEALASFQRALAIDEAVLGPDHALVAGRLHNIGVVLEGQGRHEDALAHHRRSLAIYERALGPESSDVALALWSIAGVLRAQGELATSLTHYRQALGIAERALGSEHPQVALVLDDIGRVRMDQGELDEAETHLRRALAIREATQGPAHPEVARTLLGLVEVALRRHDPAARELAERAVAILERSEVAPERLAEARFALARALWADRGQRARSHALGQQARETFTSLGAPQREHLDEVLAWLVAHPEP